MSQHDYNLANASGASFRADLNNALSAIVSINSGSSSPGTTFAGQVWEDTSTTPSTYKLRNAANSAWISLVQFSAAGAPTFSADLTIPDKIIHSGDTDTFIRFPAADTFSVDTAGA